MGQQTILVLNQEEYSKKFHKDFLRHADDYYLSTKFKLGLGVDLDKLRHTQMFYDILCTDNCEVIDYIWDKIEGKLDNESCKKRDINNIKECLPKDGCIEDFISSCCVWETVAW